MINHLCVDPTPSFLMFSMDFLRSVFVVLYENFAIYHVIMFGFGYVVGELG